MPFYEYLCSSCGEHHEELQKVTDRPLRKCPACGRSALKRLVSAPVFRLKGGGTHGDMGPRTASRLAILPDTTHVTLMLRMTTIVPMVNDFLDAKPAASQPESTPDESK